MNDTEVFVWAIFFFLTFVHNGMVLIYLKLYLSETLYVLTLKEEVAKKILFQFQCVTWKLEKALGNLPYDCFDISEEVQEQVGFKENRSLPFLNSEHTLNLLLIL